MLLSAAIIVRNEAEHLAGCLDSIASVVDEIVVVDTGSTDETVEIARAAGATVRVRPWNHHFGEARNAALDLAGGDWILYIDADERLRADAALRVRLSASPAVAGLVLFRPGRHYTRYREYRLFRNRADIRFRGAMHETMVPDILRVVEAEGAPIEDMPAEIDHLGYDGAQDAKHRRNLPLLLRQVEDDPGRVFVWYHLGIVHDALGDAASAEAAWVAGLEAARRESQLPPLAVLVLARLALFRLHSGREASELVDELKRYFPDDPLTTWVAAAEAMSASRWAEAVPLLEALAAVDPDDIVHPVVAYDRRMFAEHAPHALGLCWFHLGDDSRAERWFSVAAAAAPNVEEYRVKRELAASRLRARTR